MDQSAFAPGITLEPGRALRLENAFGRRIAVLRGNVWITQDGDPRDVVLSAGDDFVLDRRGPVLVTALDGAAQLARLDGPDAAS